MGRKSSLSFADAALRWVSSRNGLRAPSAVAYLGEVNRFAEYMADQGIRNLSGVKREHWWAYLKSLSAPRQTIPSRRKDCLRSGSIKQAERITKSFLMWAADHAWVGWIPTYPEMRPTAIDVTEEVISPVPLPREILLCLIGEQSYVIDGEEQCRAHLTLNLAFWGALRPSEISPLRAKQLEQSSAGSLRLNVGERSVLFPEHVALIWAQYQEERKEHRTPITEQSPIISHLMKDKPLSSWSVWNILRDLGHDCEEERPLCPREIRNAFLQYACGDAASYLSDMAAHIGVAGIKVHRRPETLPIETSELINTTVRTKVAATLRRNDHSAT